MICYAEQHTWGHGWGAHVYMVTDAPMPQHTVLPIMCSADTACVVLISPINAYA